MARGETRTDQRIVTGKQRRNQRVSISGYGLRLKKRICPLHNRGQSRVCRKTLPVFANRLPRLPGFREVNFLLHSTAISVEWRLLRTPSKSQRRWSCPRVGRLSSVRTCCVEGARSVCQRCEELSVFGQDCDDVFGTITRRFPSQSQIQTQVAGKNCHVSKPLDT